MLSGHAASVALTLAALSVAVPLKLTVAGTAADAANAAEPVKPAKPATPAEPVKASGASAAKGTEILDAPSATAPSLMSAGDANVSSSQFTLPPRTATSVISIFQGFGAVFASF